MKEAKKWWDSLEDYEQSSKSREYLGIEPEEVDDYNIKDLYEFYETY